MCRHPQDVRIEVLVHLQRIVRPSHLHSVWSRYYAREGWGVKGHLDGSHNSRAEKFSLSTSEQFELLQLHQDRTLNPRLHQPEPDMPDIKHLPVLGGPALHGLPVHRLQVFHYETGWYCLGERMGGRGRVKSPPWNSFLY
jgi:hypothetical protein